MILESLVSSSIHPRIKNFIRRGIEDMRLKNIKEKCSLINTHYWVKQNVG